MIQMKIRCSSLQDTRRLAGILASYEHAGDIIDLYGTLGAGKTAFTRFFIPRRKNAVGTAIPTALCVFLIWFRCIYLLCSRNTARGALRRPFRACGSPRARGRR